jgi:hypothetical protein
VIFGCVFKNKVLAPLSPIDILPNHNPASGKITSTFEPSIVPENLSPLIPLTTINGKYSN